jgi:Ca-activated chloride channel family protein
MSFAHPQWLNALYLVPALVGVFLYGAKRRRQTLAGFAGEKYEESLAPGRSWRKGVLKAFLRVLGYSLLVLALAGPQIGSQLVKVEREGIDLVIALVVSLSMLAEDMKPNRLERAKQEIVDLIQGLKGDRVGIVVFAGDAFVLCPLTVDYDAALMFSNTADVDVVSKPGTSIHEAIRKSVALFPTTQKADRVIILVTDGETHDGDPLAEAKKAAEDGIRIYTIGIGNPSGELIPLRGTDGSIDGYKKDKAGETVLTRLDETMLRKVAKATRGQYLPATRDGLELKVLYREISGMEKKTVKGEFMERKKDRFVWFLAAAFFVLALDLLISAGGAKRSPRKIRILHTGAAGILVLFLVGCFAQVAVAKGVDKARIKSGNKYYNASEYQKALVLYREAFGDTTALSENGEGVLYNEANTLHMMGRYPEALQKYHESFSEDTLHAGRVLYNRGNTLVKMGKLPEAVGSYLQSLRYMPDDIDARRNLELALKMIEEQPQQQQSENQDQNKDDGDKEPGDQQQQQQGDQQQQNDQQDESQNNENQQNEQPPPDSTQINPPSQSDSSNAQPQLADSTQVIELSREDALRLLKLLEEQEKELQKKKRRAAFRRATRSGRDW